MWNFHIAIKKLQYQLPEPKAKEQLQNQGDSSESPTVATTFGDDLLMLQWAFPKKKTPTGILNWKTALISTEI